MEPWMSQRVPASQTGFLEIETTQRLDYGGKGPTVDSRGSKPPAGWMSRRNMSTVTHDATGGSDFAIPYGALAVAGALIALGYVCLTSV